MYCTSSEHQKWCRRPDSCGSKSLLYARASLELWPRQPSNQQNPSHWATIKDICASILDSRHNRGKDWKDTSSKLRRSAGRRTEQVEKEARCKRGWHWRRIQSWATSRHSTLIPISEIAVYASNRCHVISSSRSCCVASVDCSSHVFLGLINFTKRFSVKPKIKQWIKLISS